MSQTTNITAALQRVRDEFNTIRGLRGDLSNLNTTDKSSLVAAINEVLTSAGVSINDAAASLTTTFSGTKIAADIAAAQAAAEATAQADATAQIAAALEGEDLSDLAAAVAANAAADANLVSAAAAQSFTAPQQAQARTNIGAVGAADLAAVTAKTDNITVTQAVDLDAMEADIATNAADVVTAQTAADDAQADVDDLVTLSGVPVNSVNLGAMSSPNITDNRTVKSAILALDTAVGDTNHDFVADFTTGLL